ncbi:MAG: glycosyltransferase family 9 protein [Alphaproteobacteria bacterium]
MTPLTLADRPEAPTRRVLIYRLGSLGDTVVALPCLHLIARAFPEAERRILTNVPVAGRAAPLAAVLGDSGLADGYLSYPVGLRDPRALWRLRGQIAAFGPEVLVYLTGARGWLTTARDIAFFRACGIGRIVGAPLRAEHRHHRVRTDSDMRESEASRLGRCLASLGDVALDDPASWDLKFSSRERADADAALSGWPGMGGFIAYSIGTKWPKNDWGDDNWRDALAAIGRTHPGLGLIALGAEQEAARSEGLCAAWPGPTRTLCGATSPRVSALIAGKARLFVGHDSGPMHLAAAMGTRMVIIFGSRAARGIWHPHGRGHHVFYPAQGGDVNTIGPDQVTRAAIDALRAPRSHERGAA